MTLLGRSPPFVLGGIQLSGLPWSLVQARRRPCSALLCTGQPFHPAPVDLGIAPSSRWAGRVSFLFCCQPSPATSLGVVHPAVREELPQEIPVAHPPSRVIPPAPRLGLKLSQLRSLELGIFATKAYLLCVRLCTFCNRMHIVDKAAKERILKALADPVDVLIVMCIRTASKASRR